MVTPKQRKQEKSDQHFYANQTYRKYRNTYLNEVKILKRLKPFSSNRFQSYAVFEHFAHLHKIQFAIKKIWDNKSD